MEVREEKELYAEDEVDSLLGLIVSRRTSEISVSEAEFPGLVFVLEDGERS